MSESDELPSRRLQIMARPIAEIMSRMLADFAGVPVAYMLVMLNPDQNVPEGQPSPALYVGNILREDAIDALQRLLDALKDPKTEYSTMLPAGQKAH